LVQTLGASVDSIEFLSYTQGMSFFFKKKAFVDCGSNLGQGFEHFKKKFKRNFDYFLFEPNPNCYNILKEKYEENKSISIFNNAVYTDNSLKTFTFTEDFDVGGSIVKDHNSNYPTSQNKYTVDIQCINFDEFIDKLSKNYRKIYVKLDIESAEYDVLEQLIQSSNINKLSEIYCEFHSQYMTDSDKKRYQSREEKIIAYCKENQVKFQLWH
jgi:FkbM family methyltransferase